ncbi:unnamed protein product, partial [marine sediment metagenome]
YDKSHPIISIRVSQDLKKQLDEIRETSDKSIGDILREAVGVQSKSIKNAWNRGYGSAKGNYGFHSFLPVNVQAVDPPDGFRFFRYYFPLPFFI